MMSTGVNGSHDFRRETLAAPSGSQSDQRLDISMSSLQQESSFGTWLRFLPAVATQSLGSCEHHDLTEKLRAVAAHGFAGIELFWDDLVKYAHTNFDSGSKDSHSHSSTQTSEDETHKSNTVSELRPLAQSIFAAAADIRDRCLALDLQITSLQPFRNYEGLRDRVEHERRVDEFRIWVKAAEVLGTRLIVIPSTFLPADQLSPEQDVMIEDLRKVADLASSNQSYPIEIGYEALAWGTYTSTWYEANSIVKAVDRANFRVVLDTFNIAGREWADPCDSTSGVISGDQNRADRVFAENLKSLQESINFPKDVCMLQVADGERMDPAVSIHPAKGAICCKKLEGASGISSLVMPSRMAWSRGHRLFYGEEHLGAYLPVRTCLEAILGRPSVSKDREGEGTKKELEPSSVVRENDKTSSTEEQQQRHTKGSLPVEAEKPQRVWLSMEVFSHSVADPQPGVVEEHARRAWASWKRIQSHFALSS